MLLWTLPVWVMLGCIASGRVGTSLAATFGLLTTIAVALLIAPSGMDAAQLTLALQRGAWIGLTIAPYILGGLAFWQMATPGVTAERPPRSTGDHTDDALESASSDDTTCKGQPSSQRRRRHLFLACFLIGPFAESATGFGAGMLGTIMLLRPLRIAPVPLMIFGLLSQTMIPWGGMGSSTLLAATYAGLPPEKLGAFSTLPTGLLMVLIWLPLFWRTAHTAGLHVPRVWLTELGWIITSLLLAAFFTWHLGPETGLLASHGLLAALYYLHYQRPDHAALKRMIRQTLPYLLLTLVLVTTRLWTPLKTWLNTLLPLHPYTDLPALAPFFHAGCLMLLGCFVVALLKRRLPQLPKILNDAVRQGSQPMLAIFLFSMIAEVLSGSGISHAYADGLFASLGEKAMLATPLASALFGILGNSANAGNSLFMASVISLGTKIGLSLPLLAALQHASGASMSLFSPVRMSMAAKLADGNGQEQRVYRLLLPYGGVALLILLGCAIVLYAV
ncbi:MAG: L-lactate permease [Lautropia sp.]|nr:L-lactate permease [Lautropia sp.]